MLLQSGHKGTVFQTAVSERAQPETSSLGYARFTWYCLPDKVYCLVVFVVWSSGGLFTILGIQPYNQPLKPKNVYSLHLQGDKRGSICFPSLPLPILKTE